MKQISALFVALLMAATTYGSANHDTARKPLDLRLLARKELFDADWQFSQDSTTWRTVNLPHDWSIEGDFDKDAPADSSTRRNAPSPLRSAHGTPSGTSTTRRQLSTTLWATTT